MRFRISCRVLVRLPLLATCAVALLAPASAAASTVCPAGPPSCDFATIQSAVDAASSGTYIRVGPGSYTEDLTIAKRVDVWADSAAGFVILGSGTAPAVTISDNASMSGGTIQSPPGSMQPGVLVTKSTGGTELLRSMRVQGGTIGVLASGGAALRLGSATIDVPGGTGLLVPAGSASTVHLDGTVVSDAAIGLDVANPGTNVTVQRAVFTVPAAGTGIRLDSPGSLTLTWSRLVGDSRAGTTGVALLGASGWWQRIERSTFRRLAVSIRSDVTRPSDSGDLSINGNVLEVDTGVVPIVLDAPGANVRGNYVACPAVSCETTTGSHSVTPWSQIVPTLYLGLERDATVVDADKDVRFHVVLEEVRADGSRETTALSTDPPFADLVHSWTETPNPVGVADARGLSSSQLVHTTGPGTNVVLTVRVQGRPATRTYLALGAAPRSIGLPRIVGAVRHGSTVTCESPGWPVPPTSISYKWAGGGRITTEQSRSIADADVRVGILSCTVIATFAHHRGAVSKRTVEVERIPLRLQRYALNAGWRIMSCGSSVATACRARRTVGVRFWLSSRSKKPVKATISMQRKVRGRWVPWVRGTIPMPMKGGSYIPGKLAASGTYRICFTVPAHDMYSSGTTRWQYWRVR